jgi:hypothetical protein
MKNANAVEIPEKIKVMIMNAKQVNQLNTAQDYVDGVVTYGIRIGDNIFIVTSNKHIFPISEAEQKGFTLTTDEVEYSRFSKEGLLSFFSSGKEINIFDLLKEIICHLRKYILLNDKKEYVLLALWIMGTYIFRVFRYYPYIHINAEKDSGKSILLTICSDISFNGYTSVSSTPAVIFRDVQTHSPTLFLDEVEKLRSTDRDQHGALMEVLKSGYTIDGKVKRCAGKDNIKAISYCTYSPKMFAGINELDDVLRDRAIPVNIQKKLKKEKLEKYTNSQITKAIVVGLRDKLYTFGLTYGPSIGHLYNENFEAIVGLEYLENREVDLWAPIFSMANYIDKSRGCGNLHVTEMMIELSRKYKREKLSNDVQENETAALLAIIKRMISEELVRNYGKNGEKKYTTDEVLAYVKRQDEYSGFECSGTKSWLTRKMSKYGVKSMVDTIGKKSKRIYIINEPVFNESVERYCSDTLPISEEIKTVTCISLEELIA